MSYPPTAPVSPAPHERLALQTLSQRRRRVWRNVIFILLITLIMVLLSMVERDNQAARSALHGCYADLEYVCRSLQAELDRGHAAPRALPLPALEIPADAKPQEREQLEQERLDRRSRYIYQPQHRAAARPGKPAVACQDEHAHQYYLRPDELHVILFDGERYTLQTLRQGEFGRLADTPGFTPPE